MKEKLDFIRLPMVVVLVFFAGNLILGATGASYEIAKRLFSMVILQTHLALLWAAIGRRYQGYKIRGAINSVVMIILFSQILIWGMTVFSYVTGMHSYFSDPVAITGNAQPISFGVAMVARAIGLVVNTVIAVILGAIGWAMGGLIPERKS